MNPGAIEEGAKVATGVVEGLKSQPIALALIVMNVIFVGATVYAAHQLNIRTTARYEAQDVVIHKLIDQCIMMVPGGKSKSSFRAPILQGPILSNPIGDDPYEDRH